MLRKIILLFRCGLFSLIFTVVSYSQYAPDPAFGNNGVTMVDFGPNYSDSPSDIMLLPDNKILTAGISENSFDYYVAMSQFLPNGQPDTLGFGIDGKILLHFVLRDQAHDIDLQPDGKIVAAGTEAEGSGGSQITPALYRFEPDGGLDTTFGDSGKIVLRYDNVSSGEFYGVSVQNDGKILAAGSSTGNANGGVAAFGAMRFLQGGQIDTSYGIMGMARIVEGLLYHPVAVLFLQDTGIVMASVTLANGIEQFVLGKMDSLGNRDTTFGGDGYIETGIPALYNSTTGESLGLTEDGKILMSGTTRDVNNQNQFSVFRFLHGGSLDLSFGTNGRTDINFGTNANAYQLKVDQNDRIVIVGEASDEVGLARLNPDGSPDISFAPGGKILLNLNNNAGMHYLTALTPLPNGDIIAAGDDVAHNAGNFIITRITNQATGIAGNIPMQPDRIELFQNYPNPFNPSTAISFNISRTSFVSLKIYDVLGNEISTLVNNVMQAGIHTMNFNASSLSSGVYFYHLKNGEFSEVKKMILLR